MRPLGARRQDAVGLVIMAMGERGHLAADHVDLGLGDDRDRIHLAAAIHLFQIFARQIEPADGGILVDVAQDVGELQRPAQMMRQVEAGPSSMPKTLMESRPTALATRSQ